MNFLKLFKSSIWLSTLLCVHVSYATEDEPVCRRQNIKSIKHSYRSTYEILNTARKLYRKKLINIRRGMDYMGSEIPASPPFVQVTVPKKVPIFDTPDEEVEHFFQNDFFSQKSFD